MKKESKDLGIMFLYPIVAVIISFLFKPNAFGSVMLFLAVPSIYLSIRGVKYIKKSFIFSLVTTIPLMIVIDYIAHLTGMWNISNSILNGRLFDYVTIEVILWAFFTCYLVVIFYEYFIDKHASKRLWTPKLKYLLMTSLLIFIAFIVMFFNFPNLLNIPYFYLCFGVVLTLLPFLFQWFEFPHVTKKFLLGGIFFFYRHSLYEITALKIGWWTFPGKDFIGLVSLFGVTFPIEEVIFWFILLALAILSFYEYFDDNEK